jgi:hypothetical protein
VVCYTHWCVNFFFGALLEKSENEIAMKIRLFSVRCKTNTIPISMHQMRISTNKVFSVLLRSKVRHDVGLSTGPYTMYTYESEIDLSVDMH